MQHHYRTVVSVAVMAALASGAAQAVNDKLEISGFGDITYMVTDDTTEKVADKSPTEGKFGATAEVDFVGKLTDKITVRVDADLDLAVNGGASAVSSDSGRIEQALFAFAATDKITVLGGVLNNPIGWEKEDAPDMYQTTHGQIWAIMDGQTVLYGNNLAGVAGAINLGKATVTLGMFNDLYHVNEENSFAVALNATPIENLDIEAGYVTQASRQDSGVGGGSGTYGFGANSTIVGSAENWWDINATYRWKDLIVAAEYLSADKVVDAAYALYGNYSFGNGFGVTARYDEVGYQDPYDAVKDTTTMTLAGSYMIAKNLSALLEWRTHDDANDTDGVNGGGIIGDGDVVQVEFVATF